MTPRGPSCTAPRSCQLPADQPERPDGGDLLPRRLRDLGATNPDYTLTIDAPAAPAANIPPDRFEPNNTQGTAYNLGAVQNQQQWTGLSIYRSGLDEWYAFEVANSGNLSVRIDFSYVQGGLNLQVIDPSGNATVADTTNNFQQVSLTGARAGTYYVHIAGYDGATNPDYTLTINAPVATIPPDWAEPDNTRATAHSLGTVEGQQQWPNQQQSPLSIYQSGKDEWFAFTTSASGSQGDQVEIDFNASQGALDLQVTNSSGNLVGQLTATGSGRAVSLAGLPAGTYDIRVFGVNGATNPDYTLLVDAPQTSNAMAQWDVLFYGDGDNNLDPYVALAIQTMEEVQVPQSVNVGVLWGRSAQSSWGGDTLEGWLSYHQNSQYGYFFQPTLRPGHHRHGQRVQSGELPGHDGHGAAGRPLRVDLERPRQRLVWRRRSRFDRRHPVAGADRPGDFRRLKRRQANTSTCSPSTPASTPRSRPTTSSATASTTWWPPNRRRSPARRMPRATRSRAPSITRVS